MSQEQQLDDVLKGRFVRRVFADTIKDLDKAQVTYMRSRGFGTQDWYNGRHFTASETALQYAHLHKHRFVDMKHRNSKQGRKRKKKVHPVHNRIIFGHYNDIIRQLAYGFTEAVKQELRTLEQ